MKTQLNEIDLNGKKVFFRVDLNVPIQNGVIQDMTRIERAIPGILYAFEQGAKVTILTHLGRPIEGTFAPSLSTKLLIEPLSKLLDKTIDFVPNPLQGIPWSSQSICLCENVRFIEGEKVCNENLSKRLASACDVFVMDAFATIHRQHASTYGIAQYAKHAIAGPLLFQEINALNRLLNHPKKPLALIMGGSKISTKLPLLKAMIPMANHLLLGGGILNTFLKATGHQVGQSLIENDLSYAETIKSIAKEHQCEIAPILDVVVSSSIHETQFAKTINLDQIKNDDMILDIGPKTAAMWQNCLLDAHTILWNGPVGVFEIDAFAKGTELLAHAIARSKAYSVAGGGDTLSAISKFGISNQISYISTGGGAFLAYCANKNQPILTKLR